MSIEGIKQMAERLVSEAMANGDWEYAGKIKAAVERVDYDLFVEVNAALGGVLPGEAADALTFLMASL